MYINILSCVWTIYFCNMVASERWYFHWYFFYCDNNIHERTVSMRARLCWTPLWSWSSGSLAYTYLSAVKGFWVLFLSLDMCTWRKQIYIIHRFKCVFLSGCHAKRRRNTCFLFFPNVVLSLGIVIFCFTVLFSWHFTFKKMFEDTNE